MELFVAACLVGAFIGVYCNFLLLVPLTLATVVASGAAAASQGQTISGTLLAILVPAVALQGGYMIGLTSRELLNRSSKRI
ncbi:hypothetical protein [Bradyrhizobium valentinum]|uniref:Uncharacterized protein n=1 Tax=Bradyrhizobium valentinum TaxID=1518501 RepID=A0A0R3L639_9BRAD|nr:hypothetical protein [Bradyrhizobium valentinum]KRR03115.1 hypothetical protein CP49_03980 [Bradyrhizobium valentinum]KRR14049.1 hypothetical protein CQ10_09565 [Bradyrhizobium valentinum]